MEFNKIRVRNLPTEEEYIQEKNKEYQALAKVPKFSLISNSIGALIVLVFAGIAITKSLHFDVEAFIVTMFGFGGFFFLCCKWNFDILKGYQAQKENYELFQTYLSFDTEDEMKFVKSDTEVCGKFTGLYFIRMLKENQHPRVWCELLSETAAELWFTYKERNFVVPIAASGVVDDTITDKECIYVFNPKEDGIIYYKQRKPKDLEDSMDEIIIEIDDN